MEPVNFKFTQIAMPYLVGAVLMILVSCQSQSFTPVSGATIFRDDFDSATLTPGWIVEDEDENGYSLTTRAGFLRIETSEGSLAEGGTVTNLFLREVSGDFVLLTRLEFDPTGTRQLAGLVVRDGSGAGAALTLSLLRGELGVLRSVLFVANSQGAQQQDFDATNATALTLRLKRSGESLYASFSLNGDTFTALDAFNIGLADTVQVGIGAINSEGCGDTCNLVTPADFDFFEIQEIAQ